jgi:hypothetical protein
MHGEPYGRFIVLVSELRDDFVMSPRADDYRKRAAECGVRAEEARDAEVKRQFEELRRQWLEMANQVDRQKW